MSVVIACKFKNGVVIGADRQVTSGGNASKDTVSKIKKISNKKIAIGSVGSLRYAQQFFSIADEWFQDINTSHIGETNIIAHVNKLTSIYRTNDFITGSEKFENIDENNFLIVTPYEIYNMDGYGSITEEKCYTSIGCGRDKVSGYLNIVFENPDIINDLEEREAKNIIGIAIKNACKDDIYIDDNVDFTTLYKEPKDIIEDENFEIISKCEYKILDKNENSGCDKSCEGCSHSIHFIYNRANKRIENLYW